MRILVALHQVMDLGGIINHTEQLIGGLKDLGHDVMLKEFVYSERNHDKNIEGDWKVGPSGIPHDQGKGWKFKRLDRVSYKGPHRMLEAKRILSAFDMVIWTVPVPSKNKHNLGNDQWLDLYDLKDCKQVAFIHDGNAMRGYPHITRIQEHVDAFACVHHCALGSSGFLDKPRALILNPQENPVREVQPWENKRRGFVNMQTFKAWKHVHELIEAIVYMPEIDPDELREVAGRGIEYQYMTSEDKCKENYFHGASDNWFSGWKFWEAALGHGMNYHDYWNVDEVNQMLTSARILVDPSWSKRYSQYGGHYNRVAVDAMIHGCVPVARRMGMGTDLFLPNINYVEIRADATPQEYADVIIEAGNMPVSMAKAYREANLELLPLFDRKAVAQKLIDLVHMNTEIVGRTDFSKVAENAADDIMFNHFGIL